MSVSPSHPTAHTVPPPVLFNAWKHHADWVRCQIVDAVSGGESSLRELAEAVIVTGTQLMDFYTGMLDPWAIGQQVVDQLKALGKLDLDPFAAWVAETNGYRLVDLSDGSRWVLRVGDGERYVHLHTARYSSHSVRVPGISLKTAIVANALAGLRGRPVADLVTVNDARGEYLRLPPIARLSANAGLGKVMQLLQVQSRSTSLSA